MESQDYWEKRALKDKKISVNHGEKYINTKLRTAYGKASKELEEELAKLYKAIGEDNAKLLAAKGKLGTAAAETKGLLNRLLEEREKLEQAKASGSLPEEMIKAAEEKLDAMEQLLKGKSKTGYITHLEMMKQQIDMTALSLGNRNGAEMYDFLQNQYKSDYFRKIFNTQQALSFGKDFVSPDQNAVKEIILRSYAKSNFSRRIWKNASGFAKTVKDSLTTGLIKGESIDEMTKRITSKVGVAERHARRLVRTETARIHEESTMNAYRECNIERYIYMATLDRRTSEICQELDGKSFSLEEAQMGVNYPPMHPNCRSTTVADTKLLQRIARGADGKNYKVDGKLTYKEWYEGLSQDEQGRMQFENKKEKNKARDKKELEKIQESVGKVNTPSLAKYQQMKYNDTEEFRLLNGYKRAVEKGDISALVGMDVYKEVAGELSNLVGVKTSDGTEIKSFSAHMVDRVIGQVASGESKKGKRTGVPVNALREVLEEGTVVKQRMKDGILVGKTYWKGQIEVTVNPSTGNLVQVNPSARKEK